MRFKKAFIFGLILGLMVPNTVNAAEISDSNPVSANLMYQKNEERQVIVSQEKVDIISRFDIPSILKENGCITTN